MDGISVIIPTYRPQEYLFSCLSSLQEQTLTKDKFEVLIILNGDNEPYFSQITEFLAVNMYPNFKLYYSDIKGVSSARNLGIEYSQFDNLVFLDDDDFISPNYLSSLLELSTKHKSTMVVANFKTYFEGEISNDYISNAFNDLKDKPFSIVRHRKFLSSACGKLIPKELIKDYRFNPQLYLAEDSLFMFEISSNISRLVFTKEDCIYYRRLRKDSVSRKKSTMRKKISDYFMKTNALNNVYFKNISKYNFVFYTTRILAFTKVFLRNLIR